ncbi:hypothetical protein LCGC14_3157270, partial [marine sediment metagenome]
VMKAGTLTDIVNIQSTLVTLQESQVIDVTGTEALLVRKNSDGGDVLIVDTTNVRVGVNGTPSETFHVFETRAGANNSVIFETALSDAADQVRIQVLLGGDSGSGTSKGLVIFSSATLSGWADYESRSLGFFTGAGAGATQKLTIGTASPHVKVTGDLQVFSASTEQFFVSSSTPHVKVTGDFLANTAAAGGGFTVASTGTNQIALFKTTGVNSFSQIKIENDGGAFQIYVDPTRTDSLIFRESPSTDRMILYTDGTIMIGNTGSTSGKLHVDQTSSTGAKPVLFLDQGDASEQAILISYDAADVDMILIDVDVTGDPQFKWDNSQDNFLFTKGIT